MRISVWDLFKFLFRHKIAIVIVTVLSFFAAKVYVDRNQTYSAKVIIQYNDSCIGQGKTLDGKLFDSNEIKAPKVILSVLDDLGYENKKIESIREKITVSPIVPKTADNLKAAKEKMGEEYRYYPKTFEITYKGGSSFESTRDVLSSVVENYFKYYSETYLYSATLYEIDYQLNKRDYDYIEQAEQISNNLKQTIDSLSSYAKDSAGFRSTTTGLTFDDLLKEYERIRDFDMPAIFSKIMKAQITKNEQLLLNKFNERLEQDQRDKVILDYKAEQTYEKLETYVTANRKKPGMFMSSGEETDENATPATILQGVQHDFENNVEEQTTYDALMTNYANDLVAANDKKKDSEYCIKVLNNFIAECDPSVDREVIRNSVETSIADVLSNLEDLYRKSNQNISDYNEFIPALHIRKLSGVTHYGNMVGSVYKVVAIMIGFILSCLAAIAYEIVKKYSAYSKTVKEAEAEEESEKEE